IYGNFLGGRLHELLVGYVEKIHSLLDFLAEYVSVCFTVRRLFADLLHGIGLEDAYHDVLREGGLLGGARVGVVDAFFLRFHVRSTVNALAPPIDMTLKGLPLSELELEAIELESKFLPKLISSIRAQVSCWDGCVEHLGTLVAKAESGSAEDIVESVKDALEALMPFVKSVEEAFSQIKSRLRVEKEGEIFSFIEELSRRTEEFLEKWRESHEATVSYLQFVLSMVWGDAEYGLDRLREAIQGRNVEEIVPEELPPRDVAFAASRAMIELNEAADVSRRQMERLHYFAKVAEVFESAILMTLAKETKMRFELFNEFQQRMFEDLKEIKILAEKQAQR
ncbi:MAG: hypothetical protein KIH01_06185, partial [Candidatus Freyarchaeota archaeon]|nr:hypothetical protein [Candidatus Jordarchaeia archaeon]